jgi:hypothetical protein
MTDWSHSLIDPRAFAQLADELPGTELQSLLLEVMRRRAAARSPHDVLAQFRRDRFVAPSTLDQRVLVALDAHLLAAAAEFEALELSPLAPLGASSTIAPTDQHRVVSALRATEVVSDPTNVLALICAERLRAAPDAALHLATSQRVVRAQPVPPLPGYAAHFRIFVLASAGRETAEHGFTVATLARHVRALVAGLDRLERDGYAFGARRVEVLARADRAAIGDRVADAISVVPVARGPLDHAYYSGGVRYRLWVTATDGTEAPIGDGGAFDWVAKLTANRRHVFVASGFGAQLAAFAFRSVV